MQHNIVIPGKPVVDLRFKEREETANYIIGNLAIEGMKMSDAGLADLHKYVQGDLTSQDMIQNAIKRHKRN